MIKGMGRGRGYGRSLLPPPVVDQREDVTADTPAFQQMYNHEKSAVHPDSGIGRSRGRGLGRGRLAKSSQGPGINIPPRSKIPPFEEPPMIVSFQELESRFEDVVQDRPEFSMKAMGTPPQKNLSDLSPSSVKKMNEKPEEPIISQTETKEQRVGMTTSYMRLNLVEGHPGVVKYKVIFEPKSDDAAFCEKVLVTKECKAVVGTVWKFFARRMILFLPKILPNDITFIETHLESGLPEHKIKVSVKFRKVPKMKDSTVLCNIVLKDVMRVLNYTRLQPFQWEYYDLQMITALHQHKLDLWPGLKLSFKCKEGGYIFSVDTCTRVVDQETVYEQLKSLNGISLRKKKVKDYFINKVVMTKYNPKCYEVDDVDFNVGRTRAIAHGEQIMKHVEYLKTRFSMKEIVTDMEQPLLISVLKPRKNVGCLQVDLIPQSCYETYLIGDDFKDMPDLAESAALILSQRNQNLKNFTDRLLENQDVAKILCDWGLQIEGNASDAGGCHH